MAFNRTSRPNDLVKNSIAPEFIAFDGHGNVTMVRDKDDWHFDSLCDALLQLKPVEIRKVDVRRQLDL
jgi:hypothetical protein